MRIASNRRSRPDWYHLPMTSLMLMTSAVSVVICYGGNATSFKPRRKLNLMPIDFRPHYTQLYQVEKLKAQILRGLNLTSVPEPSTKKPPKPVQVLNHLPVPSNHPRRTLSAVVFSEPVDMRKKMADRLLFRVGIQRKKSSSINRVSLLLRLRSSKHTKRKHRKRQKPKKKRQKLPDLRGKGVQSDQQKRTNKKKRNSRLKKKSRSRRKKSYRVKVLVQTINKKSGKFKRVAVQRVVIDKKFHWIKLPIPISIVSRALQSTNQSLVLRVRCKRCHKGGVSIDSPVPRKKSRPKNLESASDLTLNPNRPYLVIFASKTALASLADPAPSRSARHVDGVCPNPSHGATPCCSEAVHVTFQDLGWDHWIVDPEGFSTVMCRGVCDEQSNTKTGGQRLASQGGKMLPYENHTRSVKSPKDGAIVTGVASGSNNNRDDRKARSCQPLDRSSLAVIYYSDHNTLTRAVIPEVITNTCSCLGK